MRKSAVQKSKIVDMNGQHFAVRNHYEGATTSSRGKNWISTSAGPNRSLTHSLPRLIARSRDAERNNPLISNALVQLVCNEVGTGVACRSDADDSVVRDDIDALYKDFTGEVDADEILNNGALQALLSMTRRMSGECFVRRRRRTTSDDLAVPLQVQLLEPEFVPITLTRKAKNGNKIIQGIEFNRRNQRVAYWMYPDHPQDGIFSTPELGKLIRVRASDVIHHYRPIRPGQIRGRPDTGPALLKAKDFDEYDDAELMRKKTRAPYTGFLQRTDPLEDDDYKFDPLTGEPLKEEDGQFGVDIDVGTLLQGFPGEELQMFPGDDTGRGYKDFMREQKMGLAAALKMPYQLFSGDWSDVNDRLVRAIVAHFRRQIAMDQELISFQYCERLWGWFLDAAVLGNRIDLPNYFERRREYTRMIAQPQVFPYSHPEQDVKAALKEVESGFKSRDEQIIKRGGRPDKVDEEQVAAELRLRNLRVAAGLLVKEDDLDSNDDDKDSGKETDED